PSLVRLDIATAVPIKLINERKRVARPAIFRQILPRNVFLPSGYKYQFRIDFHCSIPLLLKVPTIQIAIRPGVKPFTFTEAPSECARQVKGAAMPISGWPGILGNAYRNLFEIAILPFNIPMLGIIFQPTPLVV